MLETIFRKVCGRIGLKLLMIGDVPLPAGRQMGLLGDRDVEWSYVVSRLGDGPGKALDFGCGGSALSLAAARRGYDVTAIDMTDVRWPYVHPGLQFRRGELTELGFAESSIDLIINCSSIEHAGVAGRYGVTEMVPDADLTAMAQLRRILKPGGRMILTIPVGMDGVYAPLHRVYGENRLYKLLEGWTTQEKQFWTKNERSEWAEVEEKVAITGPSRRLFYGLGCFVLGRGA